MPKIIGTLLLLQAILAAAGVGFWLREKRIKEEARSKNEAAQARAARQTPAVRPAPSPLPTALPLLGQEGVDADGYPRKYVDREAFRSLLHHGKFDELDRYFDQLQGAFEEDARKEYWPDDAADAFGSTDPELLAALDGWVNAKPGSFAAHLARGAHWVSVGYARRGGAWASETHKDNFEAMAEAFSRAEADLKRSLELRPRLVAAMRGLLQMYGHSRHKNPQATLAQAEAACPSCVRFRVSYLLKLQPRWGGSYEAMEAFVAAVPVATNPRLRLLKAYIDLDKAAVAREKKQLDEALAAVERACSLGAFFDCVMERYWIRIGRGETEQALEDLNRAAELRPGASDPWLGRAALFHEQKRWEQAGRDLLRGLRIEPTHRRGKLLKPIVQGLMVEGWEIHKAGRRDDALRLYELASELDPLNQEVLRWRSKIVLGERGEGSELEQLEQAARAAPDDFRAQQQLDYALARQGKYAQVIELWKQYLARKPDDARAYLERAGAYHHLGKRDEAAEDFAKSCELGLTEGCARSRQFPRRTTP